MKLQRLRALLKTGHCAGTKPSSCQPIYGNGNGDQNNQFQKESHKKDELLTPTTKADHHPYHKQPGKSTNHETCPTVTGRVAALVQLPTASSFEAEQALLGPIRPELAANRNAVFKCTLKI